MRYFPVRSAHGGLYQRYECVEGPENVFTVSLYGNAVGTVEWSRLITRWMSCGETFDNMTDAVNHLLDVRLRETSTF